MKRIILGSNSPRRRELLAGLDIPFTVDTGNSFEERLEPGLEAHEVPLRLSEGKSLGFHRLLEPDEVLITSDTVVIVGREVLGKPRSRADAERMLHLLSGRAHEVVTAVTIRDAVREETFSVSTQVHFVELTQAEIDHYIDKYQPFDKAGAYGIQEWIGYVGISSIEGSFYNVMGFPVHRVWHELQRFL
jgi:septum formation protein